MKILVSGVSNIETSLEVDKFPIDYTSVNFKTFKINSNVGGVGYNLAKALTVLGSKVNFLTLVGDDNNSLLIEKELHKLGISNFYMEKVLNQTPQSVVLYDKDGKRQVNTDLKDIFEKRYTNEEKILSAIKEIDYAILTNVNYSRYLIPYLEQYNIPFATDLQAIDSYDNEYNLDYMQKADMLFLSNDNLKIKAEDFIKKIFESYKARVVGVGLGKDGVLLGVKDKKIKKYSAPNVKVVNTIGAGDALFSSFTYFYTKHKNEDLAIKKSLLFVGNKIQYKNSSEGFINECEVEKILTQKYKGDLEIR